MRDVGAISIKMGEKSDALFTMRPLESLETGLERRQNVPCFSRFPAMSHDLYFFIPFNMGQYP